jgi:hypothetical protein
MLLTLFKKMNLKTFEKFCENDLNQRENEENSRISYNIDDRF